MQTFRDDETGFEIRVDAEKAGITYPISLDTPGVGNIPLTPAEFDTLYGLMQRVHHYAIHGDTL